MHHGNLKVFFWALGHGWRGLGRTVTRALAEETWQVNLS